MSESSQSPVNPVVIYQVVDSVTGSTKYNIHQMGIRSPLLKHPSRVPAKHHMQPFGARSSTDPPCFAWTIHTRNLLQQTVHASLNRKKTKVEMKRLTTYNRLHDRITN